MRPILQLSLPLSLLLAACSTEPGGDTGKTGDSADNAENQAPSAATVEITPGEALTADALAVKIVTPAVDPDGDTVQYLYAWSVDGAARTDLTTGSVPERETTRGQTWTVVVTPSDGELDGPTATASALIINSPPTAAAELSPDSPGANEDVVATVVGQDDDGDAVSFTYAWSVDGEESAITDLILPAGTAVRGETWTFTATPSDADGAGEPATTSVTFGNSAPDAGSVVITPDPAAASDVLVAVVTGGSDLDGDALTYTYAWSVEGVVVQTGALDNLVPGAYAKHQAVMVTVTPNDGADDGAPVDSPVLVISNAPPGLGMATIDPGTVYEDTTANCLGAGWMDVDGDPEGYTYSWAVNGTIVATTASIDGSLFTRGDVLVCAMTPFDGETAGLEVSSAPVPVGNTAPVIANAALSNTSPGTNETLDVTVTSSDADGDGVNYQYEWFVNGVSTATTRSLTGSSFVSGDVVYVIVTPSDGLSNGAPVTSDAASVVNTAPTVGSVGLAPGTVDTNDTITAMATGSDDDGDAVALDYAWYVNGSVVAETGSTLDGNTYFDKGDAVYVEVTPSDATSIGTMSTSGTTTISNAHPSSPVAAVTPASPLVGEDLVCGVGTPSTDDDGDVVTYTVAWRVSGVAYTAATTTTLTGDTIPGSVTSPRDSWTCSLTPNDGTDDGGADIDTVTVDLNLVAWYPFDGDADDESGYGHNGTASGAVLVDDRNGYATSAYDFDGVNDYIDGASVNYSSPTSLAVWVRSGATNDIYDTVFGWNTATTPYAGIQVMANGDGELRARIGDDTSDLYSTSSPDGDGAWHLVTITRSTAGDVTLYIDGVAEDSGTSSAALGFNHHLYFGKSFQPDSFAEYFTGSIDDIRVYNVELTASQVSRLAAL